MARGHTLWIELLFLRGVVHGYKPATQEVDAVESRVPDHPQLHIQLEA